jgi:hypothetical protein
MAIVHFKVCMPMRWLAGNTHFLFQQGYHWSTRSMGKAIDALYDAMAAIQDDGSLYLNEDFMNSIFDKIYIDDDGNPAPLPPLQEAMKYQYEEKQTVTIQLYECRNVLPYAARENRFNTNRESNGSRGSGASCNRANH